MAEKKDQYGITHTLAEGEQMRRPEGVPEENFGEPEFKDWRSRAFDLARELSETEAKLDRSQADREELLAQLADAEEQIRILCVEVAKLRKGWVQQTQQRAADIITDLCALIKRIMVAMKLWEKK